METEVMPVTPIYITPYQKAELLNPVVLAYVGDALLEVYVRQLLVSRPNLKPHDLHRAATKFVSAKAQAAALRVLEPLLTEREQDVVRRGRNAKSGGAPKNADVLDYRHSTGFESLLGYLHYVGDGERLQTILELFRQAVEKEI